jgi:hypothetical protein
MRVRFYRRFIPIEHADVTEVRSEDFVKISQDARALWGHSASGNLRLIASCDSDGLWEFHDTAAQIIQAMRWLSLEFY